MSDPETTLNAGKRLAAIAGGRGFQEVASGGATSAASPGGQAKTPKSGPEDDISEHEDEGLNPGGDGAIGAAADEASAPSDNG